MKFLNEWSRRHFLAISGATAAQAAATLKGLAQTSIATQRTAAPTARRIPLPPEVISGGIQPLMRSTTVRPLRYRPQSIEFVIRNGDQYFNRPIYSTSSPTQSGDFRVDAGDLPEFSLYLPGHGGNLKIGFSAASGGASGTASKWAAQADEIVARYRPGRMIYEIRDPLLGNGMLRAELLTSEGSGLLLKVDGDNLLPGTRLAWAFGGVSGRKGRRGGDIGCEVQPVSLFFQVRREECDGNSYRIPGVSASRSRVQLSSKAAGNLSLTFPQGSSLQVEDFAAWSKAPTVVAVIPSNSLPSAPGSNRNQPAVAVEQPVLTGSVEVGSAPQYLTIERDAGEGPSSDQTVQDSQSLSSPDPAPAFAARSAQVEAVAQTLTLDTPDEYLNTLGPAISIAADTLWDVKQGCVMHGAVAWRQAFAGWRGPYVLDALGNHDRAVVNIRHWLKRQNVSPIITGDPATGPWDANVHLTRKEKLLHSNGDVSNNHYDMNLVFIDMTLRHLMWTGDLDLAREIWPAFQRHLAWEHRLFRRLYTAPDGRTLPLYEAYAAIWASDNLQYNGGGAAHSSAYNLFALRFAARLARALDEDPTAYETEAAQLNEGMQQLLWLPAQGAFAESKDLMEPRTVYTNPALWTVYHIIDSEVPTPRQAWQMAAERLAALAHIPIHGEGVPAGDGPDEGFYMLACSDWMPYMWSLNLLLMAENSHMALALWRVGMRDDAFRIFKGTLLDSMFMGLCPGDFHMTSALDVHRQEAQRDFGDPIGITARALVEGLFGVQPDLIANIIRIRPGFPSDWDRAALHHKDFDFTWQHKDLSESYEFTSHLAKSVPINLTLLARTTTLPKVHCNGAPVECAFDPTAVGVPLVTIHLPAAHTCSIGIEWRGHAPMIVPPLQIHRAGDALVLPRGVSLAHLDDPQHALANGRIAAPGFHTVFFNVEQGDCRWALPISFNATPAVLTFAPIPALAAGSRTEPLDLSPILKNRITEIFTRVYTEPRSIYCSLAFPDNLLGGWANPDNRAVIDDSGLRAAGGLLQTPLNVPFRTPASSAPNCIFLSHWEQDAPSVRLPLAGRARGIHLLLAGSTLPQCSRMVHGTVSVTYSDGSSATLALRNPENWWPIEQDYLLDDYMFIDNAPLPPRVDLRTGQTRILDPIAFHGKGRTVRGGAATILHLPLDPSKTLASLEIQASLYGMVIALLAATLART